MILSSFTFRRIRTSAALFPANILRTTTARQLRKHRAAMPCYAAYFFTTFLSVSPGGASVSIAGRRRPVPKIALLSRRGVQASGARYCAR